jgi:hypothetical protein
MVTAFAGAASILTPELVQTLMTGLMQGTCPPCARLNSLLRSLAGLAPAGVAALR